MKNVPRRSEKSSPVQSSQKSADNVSQTEKRDQSLNYRIKRLRKKKLESFWRKQNGHEMSSSIFPASCAILIPGMHRLLFLPFFSSCLMPSWYALPQYLHLIPYCHVPTLVSIIFSLVFFDGFLLLSLVPRLTANVLA